MRRSPRVIAAMCAAALVTAALALVAAPARAAVWSSTDRWGTWSSNGYTLYNNVWGSGYGPQTIWANSASNWGVWANHPNTGGIKAYPNATRYLGKRVSALGTTTSSFNVTVPTSGAAFTTAYDIWSSDNAHEIMLWMNRYGAVGPLGSLQTTASVGGHTWAVYRGSNGANQVYSFVRTGNTSAGTVDIRAIAQWIRARGWFGDVTIGNVQLGYEITSSSGGRDFITNSFSVTG
ncbi:GH12 family glycosyl hydrolase domain-containing protein [Actinoplanes sp. NPDC026623]|uniref:GH12 family glycosyl hydrolase domain-containing protein n=1 Tax=Actinoplanes sp. NPDC026623 TaxID=3155610 RepID=UPI0033C2F479